MIDLTRGAEQITTKEEWAAQSDKLLRVKFGIDPTNTNIHLGHLVPLLKLRQFQEAGHTILVVLGTATAAIGDPSGRDKGRVGIDQDQAIWHANRFRQQMSKIIDISNVQFFENHEWFDKFSGRAWPELMGTFTAQQLLQREDFSKRMESGDPISMKEMFYPVMQAWDSVCLKADIEIGGTEQLFNLMLGRELQKRRGEKPQMVMTMPLLRGLDGVKKMGKSLDNFIGLEEPAFEIYSKVMSIPDSLMPEWFQLLTNVEMTGQPMEDKKRLAMEITSKIWPWEAGFAAKEWTKQFTERQDPTDIPEVIFPEGNYSICQILRTIGFANSNNEVKRLITPNTCVSLGDRSNKVTDLMLNVHVTDGLIVRAGRRICKIRTL